MTKFLTPIGNSFGVVIDKALLDSADIDRDTPLRLRLFGRRIVIDPVPGEREPVAQPASSEPDLRKPANTVPILDELVSRDMDNERFRKLHHAVNYDNTIAAHRRYCARRTTGEFVAGGTNERTARRLLACLEALRSGKSWDEAIDQALKLVPKP